MCWWWLKVGVYNEQLVGGRNCVYLLVVGWSAYAVLVVGGVYNVLVVGGRCKYYAGGGRLLTFTKTNKYKCTQHGLVQSQILYT